MADVEVIQGAGAVRVVASSDGQVEFDFDFLVFTADTLIVVFDPLDPDEPQELLTLGVHYEVDGVGVEDGGSITLIGAYAGITLEGDELVIYRRTPISRTFDYQTAGDFRAVVVNREFDTLFMIAQELRRDIDLSTKVAFGIRPVGITPGEEGTIALFDADGDLIPGLRLVDVTDAAASTAADRLAVEAIAAAFGTVADAIAATAADAEQTAADRVATAADRIATAADRVLAEAAADAAAVAGPKYATEALGRAAVANGEAFLVQGSVAGAVAAYEHRRVDAGTVAPLIAEYPSAASVRGIEGRANVARQFPNLIPDRINRHEFDNLETLVSASVMPFATTYNGRECWALEVDGSAVERVLRFRVARSMIEGNVFSANALVLGVTASGAGSTTATCRILYMQMTAGIVEVGGTRVTNGITSGASAAAITIPLRYPSPAGGITLHADCEWVDLYIGIRHDGGAGTRTIYFTDLLISGGGDPTYRGSMPAEQSALNLLGDDGFVFNTDTYDIGEWEKVLVDGFVELRSVTDATATPTRSYLVPATGLLAPGSKIQGLVEALSDAADYGATSVASLALIFRDEDGDEISRVEGDNKVADEWTEIRVPAIVPAGTDEIQWRLSWFRTTGAGGTSTYAHFRKPGLVAGHNENVNPSTLITLRNSLRAEAEVFIDPTDGDDNADGSSAAAAVQTFDRVLDINGGYGVVYAAGGVHDMGGEQLDLSRVRDMRIVGVNGAQPGFERSVLRYGVKLSGITKTVGQTKIYQATVDLGGVPNFLWQDGVPDVRTAVTAARQHAGTKGRANRLDHTRIERTGAGTTQSPDKATALAEIDGAVDTDPRHWFSASEGIVYFSIYGGGDATGADIYASIEDNLTKNNRSPFAPLGRLAIEGLDVRYAGIDARGLELFQPADVLVYGAPGNCFDVSGLIGVWACEAAGAGSGVTDTGDGFNCHDQGVFRHAFIYTHDNRDDGVSSHENSVEYGLNPIAERNMGSGLTPAYGCNAVYINPLTIENALQSARLKLPKRGGVECHQTPNAPYDGGIATTVEVYGGVSIGDRNGFVDGKTISGHEAYMLAVNCIAIDPVEYGIACQSYINCEHSGAGTAKHASAGAVRAVSGTRV